MGIKLDYLVNFNDSIMHDETVLFLIGKKAPMRVVDKNVPSRNLQNAYIFNMIIFVCKRNGTCLQLFANSDVYLIVSCRNSYDNKKFYFVNICVKVTNFSTENQQMALVVCNSVLFLTLPTTVIVIVSILTVLL